MTFNKKKMGTLCAGTIRKLAQSMRWNCPVSASNSLGGKKQALFRQLSGRPLALVTCKIGVGNIFCHTHYSSTGGINYVLFIFIQSAFQLLSYPRFISVLLVFVKLVLISLRSALIITDENWPHIVEQTANFCTRWWEEENENNKEFVIHCNQLNQLIGRPSCWAICYQFPRQLTFFRIPKRDCTLWLGVWLKTWDVFVCFQFLICIFVLSRSKILLFYFLKTRAVKMEEMRRSVIIAPTLDGIHFLAPTNRPSFPAPPPLLPIFFGF